MIQKSVALIGAGAAGTSLLAGLHQTGYQITGVASRSLGSAARASKLAGNCIASTDPAEVITEADIVFIATPDGTIAEVCQQLSKTALIRAGQLYIHLSGALSSNALESASRHGANTLSMHPIQSFTDPILGAELLKDTVFCLEGNEVGIETGKALVNSLGGRSITINSAHKPIYHAALSISSNYLIVIEYISTLLLQKAGIPKQQALSAITPLIHGSVAGLEKVGLPDSLTGPISRGDIGTIEKHLLALQTEVPEFIDIYKKLGAVAVELAKNKGHADPDGLERIEKVLD